MEGFVDKIDDNKYLGKWETILTDGRTHLPKHITFHDAAAISARWNQQYVNDSGPVYYRHWLACQQTYGAGNEDCRKLRWWAQQITHPLHLAEWDDWWKDEHYDLQIGQHWNRICGEEFEEASNLLKDLKEKREGLAAKFRDLLKTKTAEDPMGKILHEVAQLEEPSKTPVADLVEAGTLSKEAVEAAAALKIKELKALRDDATWAEVKGSLLNGVTTTCSTLKKTSKVVAELKAQAELERNKTSAVKLDIPHMRVNYEKPGLYEYDTWFGKFLPRTPQFGFAESDEE
uniref:COX6b-1 n=1 Tax=Euglena gracilis TaxID=3039 RepID=UPI002FE4FAA6